MLSYVLTRYGDASGMQLREVPDPSPAADEVLVEVHAAGLNPVDYKIRQGKLRPLFQLDLPLVTGSELAGVVIETGQAVTRFSVGDRVFARVDKRRMGAFAEFAAVHQDLVAGMPVGLDFAQAAGLPLAGLTALQALRDELALGPGKRVFISGGAGGVGTLAIQLATWLGAEVATTASPRGADLVRRLGATQVVDYTSQRVGDVISGYDAALDLVGGPSLVDAIDAVRPGSTVVSIAGPPDPDGARRAVAVGPVVATLLRLASRKVRRQARQRQVTYRYLFMQPSGTDLALLAKLVDEQALEIVIDRTFPFGEIGDAFSYLEQGRAKGKVTVTMK